MSGPNGIIPGARPPPAGIEKSRRRLMWIAAFNGWSVAVCGGLCLVLSMVVSFSPWGVLIGAAAAASGSMELTGRRCVKQGRPDAVRWLAGSQVLLLAAIFIYAGYQLLWFAPEDLLKGLTPEYRDALASLFGGEKPEEVLTRIVHAIYAAVMIGTLLYQGGLCVYYTLAARRILLEQPLNADSPPRPPFTPGARGTQKPGRAP